MWRWSVLILAFAPALAHSQAEILQHDLFARPALQRLKHDADKSADKAAGPAVSEPGWNPELRAVMLAGPNSMVNVDGAIVRIGDEMRGHRLVEVHDGMAVFTKSGKRRTVVMRGGQAEESGQERP
jgi:hypothetical protein